MPNQQPKPSRSDARSAKRQRQKDAAAERRAAREAWLARRRKRRQLGIIGGVTLLVLIGVGLVVFITSLGDKPTTPSASGSPAPGASAEPTSAPTPAPIACGGKLPSAVGTEKQTYSKAEDQKLDKAKSYIWRLQTSCGQIDIKLAVDKAPKIANSIAFLTRKGFYDGLTFHRIIPDFVAQGGDPKGDGTGGAGYSVVEAPPKGVQYVKGTVAMAKTGAEAPGTSGSQFFIVHGAEPPSLKAQPVYGYLGETVAGLDVLDKIIGVGSEAGTPSAKVYIEKATIVEQ